MSDTSGHTSRTPLARFDQDSQCWRTSEVTSLWDLPMSLATLPPWGMTHGGDLYELPTPELRIVEPASSSLPTPTARDYKEQTLGWTWQRDGVIQEDALPRAITTLLPTPTVVDMGSNYTPEQWEAWKEKQKIAHRNGNGHGASLTQEAISLLPTPRATTAMGDPLDTTLGMYERRGKTKGRLEESIAMLPTPTAQAAKHPTMDDRGSGTPDDQNLWSVAGRIGGSTPQPSSDGSQSLEGQLLLLPIDEMTVTD